MRRTPTQIHETVSRFLRVGHLSAPPTWFQAVLSNPPTITPARHTRQPDNHKPLLNTRRPVRRGGRVKIKNLVYDSDRVRWNFFKDFPFEALRPISLVEDRHVKLEDRVSGIKWTKLEQRGRYPTVEE